MIQLAFVLAALALPAITQQAVIHRLDDSTIAAAEIECVLIV